MRADKYVFIQCYSMLITLTFTLINFPKHKLTMSRCKSVLVAAAALFAGTATTTAFSFSSPPTIPPNHMPSDRKAFLNTLLSTTGAVLLAPAVANADVTNKVASGAALRSVQRAQRQFGNLELAASQNDYEETKKALRLPPFSDIRKNCKILVNGGSDGPNAAELEQRYKDFIASVEKLDGTCSVAMRGRSVPSERLYEEYRAVAASLEAFANVAKESAEIPVQYED